MNRRVIAVKVDGKEYVVLGETGPDSGSLSRGPELLLGVEGDKHEDGTLKVHRSCYSPQVYTLRAFAHGSSLEFTWSEGAQ